MIQYIHAMILSSHPAALNLPTVSDPGPTYVPPQSPDGLNSGIYNPNELPDGLKNVKLSIPKGYISPTSIPPEVGEKAQKLLGERSSKNLPFNYGETFFVEKDGVVKEYLALINLHFDNHPKRELEIKDENGDVINKIKHPPFWHPGVSIFEKKDSATPSDKFKLTSSPSSTKSKSEISFQDSETTKEDTVDLSSALSPKKTSARISILKIAKLIKEFEKLVKLNK